MTNKKKESLMPKGYEIDNKLMAEMKKKSKHHIICSI